MQNTLEKHPDQLFINTRNQIAHGRDTGISIVILRDYFAKAVSVVDFIEKQLGV